jgi:hypothetical protein
VPDNGAGTITLPPVGCDYLSPQEVHLIIDGLPPGSTIELDPVHMDFICRQNPAGSCSVALPPGVCEGRGGSLGGHGDCFESTLDLTVTGTGTLAGFNRHLAVPIGCEVHTGPRNPGDPVQTFDTDMYRLEGELFGDPDFCTFKVIGGSDNGLPSPGRTTLTRLPSGDFNVDSFFDITYQIEFAGCDGSQLADYAGTTTATIRMETGYGSAPPSCAGICPADTVCEQTLYEKDDGTIDVCCDCVTEPPPCGPTTDGQSCEDVTCPIVTDMCVPTVVRQNVPDPFFPPAGVDDLTGTTGQIQISNVDGNTDTFVITGAAPNLTRVFRQDAADAGGFRTVDTEIVALELVGENPAGQQVLVHLSPARSSVGQVKGVPVVSTDFPADSFFDVFVTIDIPDIAGATGLSHAEPIRIEALGTTDVPPWGASFETPVGWDGIDLLNANGIPTGLKIVQVSHQLPPPPPEWYVVECDCLPDGACHVAFGPGGPTPVWCDGSCPVGYVCKLIGADSNSDGIDDTFECRCVSAKSDGEIISKEPVLTVKGLPAAGTDRFDSTARLTLEVPVGVLGNPTPLTETINLEGPTTVERGDPAGAIVETEIVAMQLSGLSDLVGRLIGLPVGDKAPILIFEDPDQASTGVIEAITDPGGPDEFQARSVFDVKHLIQTPLGVIPGQVHLEATIDQIPPLNTDYIGSIDTAIPGPDGTIVARITGQINHRPIKPAIPVNTDVEFVVQTVVHNAGPFGPADFNLTATAIAPLGCTITPPSNIQLIEDLAVSEHRTVLERFTVNCIEPSQHHFQIENEITPAEPGGPISDPNADNNKVSTELRVAVIGDADGEIISKEPRLTVRGLPATAGTDRFDSTARLTLQIPAGVLGNPEPSRLGRSWRPRSWPCSSAV